MTNVSSSAAASTAVTDPGQKRRLIMGVAVWVGGAGLCLAMIPMVNASGLADALKATINGILLLGAPKLFLLAAIGIMGKPGFAYLKSLIAARFRLLVALIVLSSVGDYLAADLIPMRQQHPHLIAMTGDLLILLSLFLLGGDFWDKLRALFVREATVVFPSE